MVTNMAPECKQALAIGLDEKKANNMARRAAFVFKHRTSDSRCMALRWSARCASYSTKPTG